MTKLEVEVGTDLRSAARDVASAWKAAVAGEVSYPSDKVVFRDWNALCSVLTSERYDLLRTLHRMAMSDALILASALGRSAGQVQADVAALIDIGFIVKSETGLLSAAVDEISSTIRMAA